MILSSTFIPSLPTLLAKTSLSPARYLSDVHSAKGFCTQYSPYHRLHTSSVFSAFLIFRGSVSFPILPGTLTFLFFSSVSKKFCLHPAKDVFPVKKSSPLSPTPTAFHLAAGLAHPAVFSRTKKYSSRLLARLYIQTQPCRFPLQTKYTSPSRQCSNVFSLCILRLLPTSSLNFSFGISAAAYNALCKH